MHGVMNAERIRGLDIARSHDRFKNRDNGSGPGTEIKRPDPRISTRSHEQSGILVLTTGHTLMSELTDL